MSSSRDHTTLTGLPTARETSAACTTKSVSSLRPKPPPSSVRLIVTFSGGSLSVAASVSCVSSLPWSGPQTSQPSSVTCAVQFIGSIVACARNCDSYSFETTAANLPVISSPLTARPSVFTVFQAPPSSAARYCAFKLSVLRLAFGPSSKVTLSDWSACRACQYCFATTATPFGIGTASITPGRLITDDLSKLATAPPCAGLCFTAAWTMPGTLKSRPKTALPLSFADNSTRRSGLPSSFHSLSGFGFGCAGGLWKTLPFSVKHSSALTPQRLAAAIISISRAEAPIVRSNSKNPVVLSLLPVNCQLIRGLR